MEVKNNSKVLFCIVLVWFSLEYNLLSQSYPPLYHQFTLADSLRGSLHPLRSCFDVIHYDLKVKFDIEQKSISGSNTITFDMIDTSAFIQLDLFKNMIVDDVLIKNHSVPFKRLDNIILIDSKSLRSGQCYSLIIDYHGSPVEAENPPWDGGFIWKKDKKNRPFLSVACEGLGASSWWPNKDHLSDEPKKMDISLTVPTDLMAVSNGQFKKKVDKGQQSTYSWHVSYPINNYNVAFYIGHLVHFADSLDQSGLDKPLMLDYYVLDYNLAKAKVHFEQTKEILRSFERYLGPYPFQRDGFALVEAPFLGMEHQSAIAYGNKFMKGYLGGGIPSDMTFDYLILHETGHEYWGNSVSVRDHAEMWIHEAFTTYMESLYVEYKYGIEDAIRYLIYQRPNIQNTDIMVGPLDVNFDDFASSNIYYKGTWVLHTLRHTFDSDQAWFDFFKSFYDQHKYGFADTEDFITEIEIFTGTTYRPIIHHYLYTMDLPILEYQVTDQDDQNYLVRYRWNEVEPDFNLQINLNHWNIDKTLRPSKKWQTTVINKIEMTKITDIRERYLIEMKDVSSN